MPLAYVCNVFQAKGTKIVSKNLEQGEQPEPINNGRTTDEVCGKNSPKDC